MFYFFILKCYFTILILSFLIPFIMNLEYNKEVEAQFFEFGNTGN